MIKISIMKEIIWNDKMTVSFQREIGIQISTIKNIKMYKEMLSEVLLHFTYVQNENQTHLSRRINI